MNLVKLGQGEYTHNYNAERALCPSLLGVFAFLLVAAAVASWMVVGNG